MRTRSRAACAGTEPAARRRGGPRAAARVSVLAAFSLSLWSGCATPTPPPRAEDGRLDLRGWDGDEPALIALHGAWERRLGHLVTAAELAAAPPADAPVDLHDPSLELDVDLDGQRRADRGPEGFATYRLRLLLPPPPPTGADDPWMIAIESQGRPYHLEVVDAAGRPLMPPLRAGQVGDELSSMVASDRDLAGPLLTPPDGVVDLVLQTSHFKSGYRARPSEVSIGRRSVVAGELTSRRQDRLVIIGVCLVMGLYHLGLFALRRSERAPLFFALLCLAFVVRQFFRFDLFEDRLPALDAYPLHASLEYAGFFVIVPLFAAFIRALFPADIPRRAILALGVFAALSCALVALPFGLAERALAANELAAIVVAAAVAAAMIRVALRRRDPPVTAILGAGIGVLLACTVNDILYNHGLVRTVPLEHLGMFAFIFAQAMVLALVNMRARRTAETLARGLGRFVPREFTRLLGKEGITDVELGDAVHREVTVLFCDLRGFTSLSERIEVREVFALLNAVYARLGPLVREHRGFVDKYIGDAIMALFPGEPGDAVAAAAAIAEAVGDVLLPAAVAGTIRGERPRLAVRVGIHRGPVMLGTIGERERMEATVIADAVNVASRLEGLSKRLGATILLSDEVLRGIPGGALPGSRSLGRIRLAGKRQSVGVHELYAADPPALRAAKERSQAAFEAALAAFQAGEVASAAALFREIAETCPEDQAAAVYAEAAAALADAPPEGWDGALEIRGK